MSSFGAMKKRKKQKGHKIIMPGTPQHPKTQEERKLRYMVESCKDEAPYQGCTLRSGRTIGSLESPKLDSFLLPPPDSATELEYRAFDWVSNDLLNIVYTDSIVPIIPYCNSIRMCHQTPQAMRLFFSAPVKNTEESPDEGLSQSTDDPTILFDKAMQNEDVQTRGNGRKQKWQHHKVKSTCKKTAEKTVVRKKTKAKVKVKNTKRLYSYGLLAVLSTTGFHPTKNVKVRPFCEKLKNIVALLTEEVKTRLIGKQGHYTLDFNHMEVKIYHGKDIYRDENGYPLLDDEGQEIRDDCNKLVNFHNDLCFNDQGEQSQRDTANGKHPIVTLTIGATRKLTFQHKWKKDSIWTNGETVDFNLAQGSIFCLLPTDEKPKKVEKVLHKTQHMAKFSNEGVSIALVFRSVTETSEFHKKTHRWKWKNTKDTKCKERVKSHLSKKTEQYRTMRHKERTVPKEVKGMMTNVSAFLCRLKNGERFNRSNNEEKQR